MKRIQYHRFGGPEQMSLEEYLLPALGADEILVRVKASSVNPVDWKLRNGSMKFMSGRRLPRAMGTDFSGVVESVGAAVTRLRAGDEVMGVVAQRPSGAFAQTLITKENLAVKKPTSLTHVKAAALPLAGVTAWRALVDKANLQPGQMLLVNGAYGGVGQAAVRIARSLGARVTGRVGAAALADAKAIGLDAVLDYAKAIPAAPLRRLASFEHRGHHQIRAAHHVAAGEHLGIRGLEALLRRCRHAHPAIGMQRDLLMNEPIRRAR
jgi:NADPH:quinone reductase-like Zn-dependent oxidoreductase